MCEEPPGRAPPFEQHASMTVGGQSFLGHSMSCSSIQMQQPADRRAREPGDPAEQSQETLRDVCTVGGLPSSSKPPTVHTSLSMALDARLLEGRGARVRVRATERALEERTGKKSGVFHLSGSVRLVCNDQHGASMMAPAIQGQHIKSKIRADVLLPHIPQGLSTRERLGLPGEKSQSGLVVPDPVHTSPRQVFRVSGYSGGLSAIAQQMNQMQPVGGSSIGATKPAAMRPPRQTMPRSLLPARQSAPAAHNTHCKSQHYSGIDAPPGIKTALDSCRIPLDLSSLKQEEDGIRIVNRYTRGGHSTQRYSGDRSDRGDQADQDAWRPSNARTSDSSKEMIFCNSQKIEDTDLIFMSQFESGNLLSAQRVGPLEYDLQLQVDHATTGHTQWYFFCVSNTYPGQQYRFNIINFAKPDSLYTRGQQPLFFSLLASKKEKHGWTRIGRDVRYYRNGRKRSGMALFTLSFLVEFVHAKDKCLFAHCYPYTYTELQNYLEKLLHNPLGKLCVTSDVLCTSLGGNECPILTITSHIGSDAEKGERKVIFLSSRVHPGESNSSWIMKGLLDFLLGPSAEAEFLRSKYLFKIIPMLNPDGVINGHYRCNLAGYDLNRHWHNPIPNVHPTIFHAKELLKTLQHEREVVLFCDIHGHSVKHNLFLYGCPKTDTVPSMTLLGQGQIGLPEFPDVLDHVSSFFSMSDSRFIIEKAKDHTGRVVANRELGIANSYTLEASLCGSGEGKSQCTAQFSCTDFEAMGRQFGLSLALASSKAMYDKAENDSAYLPTVLQPILSSDSTAEDDTADHSRAGSGDSLSSKDTQPTTALSRVVAVSNQDANDTPHVKHNTSPSMPDVPPEPPGANPVSAAVEVAQTGFKVATIPHSRLSPQRNSRETIAVSNSAVPVLWTDRRDIAANDIAANDTTLAVTPIVPTFRYKQDHEASRQAAPSQRVTQHPPTVLSTSTSQVTEGEDEESSSDDERHEDETPFATVPAR